MLLRLKDGMDAAEPSTNGVAACNLHRLAALFSDDIYASLARSTLAAFGTEIIQHPFLYAGMLSSVVAGRVGVRSVVFCGEGEAVNAAVGRARLRARPNTVVVRLSEGGGVKCQWIRERNPLFKSMDVRKEKIQVCADGVCKEEVFELGDVEGALKRIGV